MDTENKIALGFVGCLLLFLLAMSIGVGVGAYFLVGTLWPNLPIVPHVAIAVFAWAVVGALGARVTVNNK